MGIINNDAKLCNQVGKVSKKKRRKTDGYDKNVVRMLTMITQFGINMIVPICLCFFVGYYLDRMLGTSYITVILFFVGALAGFRNIYIFSQRMLRGNDRALKSRGEVVEHMPDSQSVAAKKDALVHEMDSRRQNPRSEEK